MTGGWDDQKCVQHKNNNKQQITKGYYKHKLES